MALLALEEVKERRVWRFLDFILALGCLGGSFWRFSSLL
jgi:hypothetical protein